MKRPTAEYDQKYAALVESAVHFSPELKSPLTPKRLQAEEREMYTKAEQARMLVELINQRKKHMGSHALQQLRGYSFAETKTLFETTMRRVNTFVPIESEVDRAVPELAAGSLKRDAEEELGQESSKRQNVTPLPKG
ncbi:hypothetical protein Tco_1499533 [Tanacetum coccineum]